MTTTQLETFACALFFGLALLVCWWLERRRKRKTLYGRCPNGRPQFMPLEWFTPDNPRPRR